MKFNIKLTAPFYTEEPAKDLEKIGVTLRKTRWGYDIEEGAKKEINSLEELLEFSKKWGPIIIDKDTIEIYNDFRE